MMIGNIEQGSCGGHGGGPHKHPGSLSGMLEDCTSLLSLKLSMIMGLTLITDM